MKLLAKIAAVISVMFIIYSALSPLKYKIGDCLLNKITQKSTSTYYRVIGTQDRKYVVITTGYTKYHSGGRWETFNGAPDIWERNLLENDTTYKVDCGAIPKDTPITGF